ncbi:MAG: TatD family hydrolase [Anaerolineales bacterium]|nr:TatD family hydrolase [Anaerolineales bacterium]
MLIDAHAHVDRYDLVGAGALESSLEEITLHKIFTISNSMDVSSYHRNLEIGKLCDLVLPIFGVHPWNAPPVVNRLAELDPFVESSPMIGEIGLDHYYVKDASEFPAQVQVFEYFLAAARDQSKPVNLHTKGAEEQVLELLDRYEIQRAIVHWYSGPLDILADFIKRGVFFTIGVELLYSEHIRNITKMIPPGQLLTETDNPGGPKGFIGEPGMPVLIEQVVQGLAELEQSSIEEITGIVHANLCRIFRDDPKLADTFAILLDQRHMDFK